MTASLRFEFNSIDSKSRYDDNRKIGKDKGALKIRNSWGTAWGEAGYGWLPYSYIEAGLADDFWCLVKAEYVQTGQFD